MLPFSQESNLGPHSKATRYKKLILLIEHIYKILWKKKHLILEGFVCFVVSLRPKAKYLCMHIYEGYHLMTLIPGISIPPLKCMVYCLRIDTLSKTTSNGLVPKRGGLRWQREGHRYFAWLRTP